MAKPAFFLRDRRTWRTTVRAVVRGLALAGAIFLAAGALPANAGGGPENVLVVVNSASAASQTIANYFIELRHIPSSNVMYLDWHGPLDRIDVNTLRKDLFAPILARLNDPQKSLGTQIDYVVYSADFPWSIDFGSDVPEALRGNKFFQNASYGSLTGMTYLMGAVNAKDASAYVGSPTAGWFNSNRYMRLRELSGGTVFEVPMVTGDPQANGLLRGDLAPVSTTATSIDPTTVGSHGFRSWYGWGPKGELMEAGGSRYLLSAMLGVTFGRGNTVQEIVQYLQRAAAADGTIPPGTIYFMSDAGVRSTTRAGAMPLAVQQLKQLGVQATILKEELPHGRPDVQGLMCGVATYKWSDTGSKILPGAICESLTSWSGSFDPKADQTPISEFLRNGAAGASGTVTEPFAIQNKFPYATVQVHYARGCTLAEAFYQSVYGPYQLIVLGDPLCRPWANIPDVTVVGAAARDVLKGKVVMHPTAKLPHGGKADRFELFVDGLRTAVVNDDDPLQLNTADYPDGDHELRVVGIEKKSIESQGRQIIPVRFDNFGKTIRFTVSPQRVVKAGKPITVSAEAPGVRGIAVYQNDRVVGKIDGEKGETTIDSRLFGEGPIMLKAVGWGQGSAGPQVISAPVPLMIENGGK